MVSQRADRGKTFFIGENKSLKIYRNYFEKSIDIGIFKV